MHLYSCTDYGWIQLLVYKKHNCGLVQGLTCPSSKELRVAYIGVPWYILKIAQRKQDSYHSVT